MTSYIALCVIVLFAIGVMFFGFHINFKQSVVYVITLLSVCVVLIGVCIFVKQIYWYSLSDLERLSKENKLVIAIKPVDEKHCPTKRTNHYHLYINNLNTEDYTCTCIVGDKTIVPLNDLLGL